jgi:hypothetical protein
MRVGISTARTTIRVWNLGVLRVRASDVRPARLSVGRSGSVRGTPSAGVRCHGHHRGTPIAAGHRSREAGDTDRGAQAQVTCEVQRRAARDRAPCDTGTLLRGL